MLAVYGDGDPIGIMRREKIIESRIEQRLEVAPECDFEKAAVEQRRERVT